MIERSQPPSTPFPGDSGDRDGTDAIRPAVADDRGAVQGLFLEELKNGTLAGNETGADLEHFELSYLDGEDDSGFWVAEIGGEIVGMVGVQAQECGTAEIRRLRVRENLRRRGLGTALLEKALRHCRERGLLKISLDVLVDRKPALGLFEKTGFKLTREREAMDRVQLDFYFDLYGGHPRS